MTKEELTALGMAELEERAEQIAEETRDASEEALETLNAELDIIEERKATIKAEAEEKRAEMQEVIDGAGEVIEKAQEERKTMDKMEIRKSPEYLEAWVENLKGRATEEQRALLTTNAPDDAGTIAVPTYVENVIHTAWENDEIMRRIRKTYFKGNLKVGYEASASGAEIHDEGGEAIQEENLVIGFVELIPATIKKMVKYSTEVLDMKGEAFVDYIVDEIEYQIVKLASRTAVDKMGNGSLTTMFTAAGTSLTTADVVNAEGLLGGEASNPVLITSRANAAALKAAALSANYGYDPFDGLEVIYSDYFTSGNLLGVIADLSGVQANFPDGDTVKFVFDEYTEAPADIVRVIGRLYMAVDVVAPKKVVAIQKHA